MKNRNDLEAQQSSFQAQRSLTFISKSLRIPRVGDTPGRNLDMDALRGLAILLVVLGHALSEYGYPYYNKSTAYVFIYSFHMPLFAFVSGFVIYGKRINPKDKFLMLIIPFLAWIPVNQLLDYYVFHETVYLGTFKEALLHPEYALWYLWFLFLCYMCLIPVTFLESRRKYLGGISLALLVIIFTFSPLNILGFWLLRSFFSFFALGYLAAKHRGWFEQVRPYIINSVLIIATALFLVISILVGRDLHLVRDFYSMGDIISSPYQFLTGYGAALLGIMASYGLIRLLRRGGAHRWLCWFGLVTMDIYVSHQIVMRISFGTGWVRVVSAFLAGVLFSLMLSFLVLRRSRILSALLLGKRWQGASGTPRPTRMVPGTSPTKQEGCEP
jgi:fucose 4-O-acetylase-like acetyltransferase